MILKKKQNELSKAIYEHNKNFKIFVFSLSLVVFLFSFISYLPIQKTAQSIVNQQVSLVQEHCPFSYQSSELSFIFPGVKFNQAVIMPECLNTSRAIKTSSIDVSTAFPSFSPIGPKFKLNMRPEGVPLNIYAAVSPFGIKVTHDEKLNLSPLISLFQGILVKGTIQNKLTLFTAISGELKDFNLELESQDFSILKQDIMGLKLPEIDLKRIKVLAFMDPDEEKIKVQDLVVGEHGRPIFIRSNGSIKLNTKRIDASKLNLTVNVELSQELLDAFSILNLIIGKYKNAQDSNNYTFKVTGPLYMPRIEAP